MIGTQCLKCMGIRVLVLFIYLLFNIGVDLNWWPPISVEKSQRFFIFYEFLCCFKKNFCVWLSGYYFNLAAVSGSSPVIQPGRICPAIRPRATSPTSPTSRTPLFLSNNMRLSGDLRQHTFPFFFGCLLNQTSMVFGAFNWLPFS